MKIVVPIIKHDDKNPPGYDTFQKSTTLMKVKNSFSKLSLSFILLICFNISLTENVLGQSFSANGSLVVNPKPDALNITVKDGESKSCVSTGNEEKTNLKNSQPMKSNIKPRVTYSTRSQQYPIVVKGKNEFGTAGLDRTLSDPTDSSKKKKPER